MTNHINETNHKTNLSKATLLARAGIDIDPTHGSVTPPLYLSSNYSFEGYDQRRQYDYTRSGNPTRDVLGDAIAQLEGGYASVITSSGISALDTALEILEKDDLIIAPHDCYGGTYRLLSYRSQKGNFRVKFVDLTDTENLPEVFKENVTMVLVETPSNPLLRLTDIARIAEAKQTNTLLVADNTFLSPVQQNPIALGADIVLHSTTKYINGHSDVVGGAVISKTKELHERVSWLANCTGVTGAPFDSLLTLRGLRTLPLRVNAQSKTAYNLAHFLDVHPAVAKVYYPGLKNHAGHDIALKQQNGFGGMISFELSGGIEKIPGFLKDVTNGPNALFCLAESLGGFESLIAHPTTMTHSSMTPEAREKAGIKDNLLRLSIGLEDEHDLENTLNYALNKVYQPT